jgi:PPP family 3-phenylpropionic acid transporter
VTTLLSLLSVSILPDGNPHDRNASTAQPEKCKAGARKFADGPFIIGLTIIALSRLAMTPVNSFLSLFIVEELRWDAVSLMWALSAASEIPIMYFSARIIAAFGAARLLAVSSVAVAARLLVYAVFPTPGGVVFGQLLHSFCYGLFHPAAISFIATRVPPERRATGIAVYLSLGSGLPTFLGSSLGGVIIAGIGYRALFAVYSLFAVSSVALYFFTRKALDAPSRAW